MKNLLALFLLLLVGCTKSNPQVDWKSPVANLLFINNSNFLTVFRNHTGPVVLSCDNFVDSLKFKVDNIEKNSNEVVEMTSDLDCTDRNLSLELKTSILASASEIQIIALSPQGNSSPSFISIIDPLGNQIPVAQAQSISFLEDTVYNGTLVGTDYEGDSLTYYISQPSKGTVVLLNPYTGAFTYTPRSNETGLDSFTFGVNDGFNNSALQVVNVSIDLVNDAPTANNQSITTAEDTPYSGFLTGADIDGDSISYILVNPPTKGVVVITDTATGAFTYTPNANENGTDSFSFKTSDSQISSALATVSLNITPVNDAPIAFEGTLTVNEDSSQSLSLVGYDEEGDGLTYNILASAIKGTLTGTAPNFIYTPNANENGTDEIVFQVSDGSGISNIATVSINIIPVNDAPLAENDTFNVVQDSFANLILRSQDIESDNLTYHVITLPTNGTLSGTGENLVYTPNGGYSGSDVFTFKVYDGNSYSGVATISLNVSPSPNRDRVCSVVGNDGATGGIGRESSTDSGTTWGSCIPQSCVYPYELVAGQCKILTIQEKFAGMNYVMSHYERDLSGPCTSTDCIYVGDKKKVVTEETSCTGLSLKDSEELFIWECVEEGGYAVFYSRANLTRYKFVSRVIDISGANPQWKNIFVTLTGSTLSGTKSKSRSPWANSLSWAANNLNFANTIYVIPPGFNSSIGIFANNIALVGKMLFNSNTFAGTNNCISNTEKCLIRTNSSKSNLYLEVDLIPETITEEYFKNGIGIYLSIPKYSYIFNSSINYFNKGIVLQGGANNFIYRTQINNIADEGIDISGNYNTVIKNSISYAGVGIKSSSVGNHFLNNTILNNEIGTIVSANENVVSNSLFFNNHVGLEINSSNNLFGNLVFLNQDQYNIKTIGVPLNNKFLFKMIANSAGNGQNCASSNLVDLTLGCLSSWTMETVPDDVAEEDFFEVTNLGVTSFESNNFTSFHSLWLPTSLSLDHHGPYYFNNTNSPAVGYGSMNYTGVKLSLNPTFAGGFKIKENNITSSSTSSSQVSSGVCPNTVGYYYNHASKKSLITATEIPWSGGNGNGLCESNEICEYSSQYGSAQVLYPERDKELCTYSPIDGQAPVNIKLYPPQI